MDKNRPFGIHTVHDMVSSVTTQGMVGGCWRRGVPRPYPGRRLVKAWYVLIGKAEAVVWPEPGDFEAAMGLKDPKGGTNAET